MPAPYFILYPRDGFVSFDRVAIRRSHRPTFSLRGDIDSFSPKSKSRLSFLCRNCSGILSQFSLTYHLNFPQDGALTKTHLSYFLNAVRRKFNNLRYLWILEFQRNGHPHYHFFSDIEVNIENRLFLSSIWNSITKEGAPHFKFHNHPKNFIPWNLNSGYLVKYLSKDYQKIVPDSYINVGRFWGASRNLLDKPAIVELSDIEAFSSDSDVKLGRYAIFFLIRYIRARHNAVLSEFGKKSFLTNFINRVVKNGKCRIPNLSRYFFDFVNYFISNFSSLRYRSLMVELVL